MINKELLKVATPEKLIKMGFVEEHDQTGDPRGIDWNMRTKHFHVLIDPWCEVKIRRLNPDTHFITLCVEDLSDLQSIVEWVTYCDETQDWDLPNLEKTSCDVCGSEDVIEAPHMGRNCNFCNPL